MTVTTPDDPYAIIDSPPIESVFRESLVARAKKRKVVFVTSDGEWSVTGDSKLGDSRSRYSVVYQPDHHVCHREVVTLVVHAASAQGAIIHALRVVSGDVEGLTAEPFTGVFGSLPVQEPLHDVPIEITVGG